MNASAILSSTLQVEQPLYLTALYYFLAPLIAGSIIDLAITKFAGSQNCTFDGKEKVCTVGGITMPAYAREAGRSIFQILVILFTIRYFTTYFRATVFPVFGLGVFLYSQPDLLEDFRRLINSLLFIIKHN